MSNETHGVQYTYGVGCSLRDTLGAIRGYSPLECAALFPGVGVWRGQTESCTMVQCAWGTHEEAVSFALYLKMALKQEAILFITGEETIWI